MKNKTVGKAIHLNWIVSSPPEYASSDSDDTKEKLLREFIELARKVYAEKIYRQVNSGAVWEDKPGKFAADLNTASGLLKLGNTILIRAAPAFPTHGRQFGECHQSRESAHIDRVVGPAPQLRLVRGPEGRSPGAIDRRRRSGSASLHRIGTQEACHRFGLAGQAAVRQRADSNLRYRPANGVEGPPSRPRFIAPQGGPASMENALWAAIRRYASLVEEETDIQALQPFLEGKASIATRQVTLQAIRASFHQAPPEDIAKLGKLRTGSINSPRSISTRTFWSPPENTSLALNAMLAVSALGSDDNHTTRRPNEGNRQSMAVATQHQILGRDVGELADKRAEQRRGESRDPEPHRQSFRIERGSLTEYPGEESWPR